MILGTGCLGERALDGAAVREALATTGLQRALLVVRPGCRPSALGGLSIAAVRAAWEELPVALAAARAARAERLIVELPRLMGLERACRELHELARRNQGLPLAVATPAAGPLADPEPVRDLLDDLAGLPLGYWHRPSTVFLSGQSDVVWLERTRPYLQGMSLDDAADGEAGLPPGLGKLDFGLLAELRSPGLLLALDVDPLPDVALLRLTLDQLRETGV
jgi:hypothetical protein